MEWQYDESAKTWANHGPEGSPASAFVWAGVGAGLGGPGWRYRVYAIVGTRMFCVSRGWQRKLDEAKRLAEAVVWDFSKGAADV